VKNHEIIADDISMRGIILTQHVIQIGLPVTQGGTEHRRVSSRVQHIPAWDIQRQTEIESKAFPHLSDTLQDLLLSDQVQSSQLIIGTEISPV
jgi:hypothetical protein